MRITAGEARIDVRIPGAGPPLVLLPSRGRSGTDITPFAGQLVTAGYRTVLPEPRGASTGKLDGLTLHDLARDIAAVIEVTCIEPVMAGHAFGNRTARCPEADRPELVNLVVPLSSSRKVQTTPEIAEAMRSAQAIDTPPDVHAVWAARFAPCSDITKWLDGWSQPVMRAYLEAAATTPAEDCWTSGSAEVLVVQGLCDVSAPVGNGRRLCDEIGARATLIELPDVGHAHPVEQPELVADAVMDFLCSRGEDRSRANG